MDAIVTLEELTQKGTDQPVPGSKRRLQIQQRNATIIIDSPLPREQTRQWLRKYGIPFDKITAKENRPETKPKLKVKKKRSSK